MGEADGNGGGDGGGGVVIKMMKCGGFGGDGVDNNGEKKVGKLQLLSATICQASLYVLSNRDVYHDAYLTSEETKAHVGYITYQVYMTSKLQSCYKPSLYFVLWRCAGFHCRCLMEPSQLLTNGESSEHAQNSPPPHSFSKC